MRLRYGIQLAGYNPRASGRGTAINPDGDFRRFHFPTQVHPPNVPFLISSLCPLFFFGLSPGKDMAITSFTEIQTELNPLISFGCLSKLTLECLPVSIPFLVWYRVQGYIVTNVYIKSTYRLLVRSTV